MAYLTLGPEFYDRNPELYEKAIKFVKGKFHHEVHGIRVIYFVSKKFGAREICVAIIGNRPFYRQPFFVSHIVSNRFERR